MYDDTYMWTMMQDDMLIRAVEAAPSDWTVIQLSYKLQRPR